MRTIGVVCAMFLALSFNLTNAQETMVQIVQCEEPVDAYEMLVSMHQQGAEHRRDIFQEKEKAGLCSYIDVPSASLTFTDSEIQVKLKAGSELYVYALKEIEGKVYSIIVRYPAGIVRS